jgi:DNA-binding transcriptional LysR family regulator
MIELRTIKYALAVAEYQGFRKAAQALFITQPALTRAIQSLEESLGTKLFDRGKRQVEPTPLGKIFLARAEEVLRSVANLRREMDLAQGLATGHLEIGSGVGPAELHMGTAVGRFCRRHPLIKLTIEVDDFGALTRRLQAGGLDLFVAETSEVEWSSEFLVTPLMVLKVYLFCRQGHPLLDRLPHLTLPEVLAYPLVMTKLPRRGLDSIAATCGFEKPSDWLKKLPVIKIDYVKIGLEAVAASNAVAFILLPMIARELKAGEFVLLPVDFPEAKTHYGIVQMRDRTPSPAAEAFIALLQEVDAEIYRTEQELRKEFFPGGGKAVGQRLKKTGSKEGCPW